ncbi:MAG: zinc ribbon domain-containing protein [Candidatus Thermoplasmatota archaeon]|nr:zinc ribbon domain-containing protein [Candidatus Thermoplasmatota archaeon]
MRSGMDVQPSSVEVPIASDYERGERFEWKSRKSAARKYAKLGLVGSILIAVAGFVSIITSSGYGYSYWNWWGGYWPTDTVYAATMILFSLGMMLFAFTFLGFHANHRSVLGLAIFIYSVIASFFLLISMAMLVVVGELFHEFGWTVGPPLSIVLGGIALGLMGVGLRVDSKHFPGQTVLVPAGWIYVIASILFMSFFSSFFFSIIWTLIFFGAILSSVGVASVGSTILKAIKRGAPEKMTAEREPRTEPMEFRFCRECGNDTEGSKFCQICGTVVDQYD